MKQVAIYLLTIFFLNVSCLDPIEFDAVEDSPLLIVDGVFTDNQENDQIRLAFTTDYSLQKFLPASGADVRIYNDQEDSEKLVEIEAGVYELKKEKISGEIGEKYYLEIILTDGRKYRSKVEKMLAVPAIDSLSFDIKIEEFINNFGAVLESSNFLLNVHTTINQENKQDFIKWQVEHISYFPEVYNPPVIQKFCFVLEELEPQRIYLLNGEGFKNDAPIQEIIARKRMNHSFSFQQSYRVFQYGITEDAFRYFSALNQVSNPSGTIFDKTPAAIKGNIYQVDGKGEQVLGYFNVAAVQSKILFISLDDVIGVYNPIDLCNFKLFRPSVNLPAECYDCLRVKNSSLERPFYW